MNVRITTLAESPLAKNEFLTLQTSWPDFIQPSPLLVEWGLAAYPDYQLLLLDEERAVARAAALPLNWDGDAQTLPARGWDGVIESSITDSARSADLNTLCALEVGVHVSQGGRGLSQRALSGLLHQARRSGFKRLLAPVRPAGKIKDPATPMPDYQDKRRADGQLADHWLRVHERLGGRIIGTCPTAMSVIAPLQKWRAWTGLPFRESGPVEVPGAISPVICNAELDYAVYVEANVWVSHSLC